MRWTFRWIIGVFINYQFNPHPSGLDHCFAGNDDNFVITQHHTRRQNFRNSTFHKHSNISGWLCQQLKSFYSKPWAITADNNVLYYYQYNPFIGFTLYQLAGNNVILYASFFCRSAYAFEFVKTIFLFFPMMKWDISTQLNSTQKCFFLICRNIHTITLGVWNSWRVYLTPLIYNIKIKTSFHGAKHVSKFAKQSWASHQPSESHLVANSELKSPPNDDTNLNWGLVCLQNVLPFI